MKIVLTVILCLNIMLFSSFTMSSPDVSAENSNEVLNSEALDRALYYLVGLGVNGEFVENENITRAEFTSLLIKTAYNGKATANIDNSFHDVDVTSEFAGDIYTAYNLGIVSGGGNFRPNDYIILQDALKMTVHVLGYGVMAEERGGYPGGYIYCALDTKVVRGVIGNYTEVLSGRDTALLLYNMLNTKLMKYKVSSGGINFNIDNTSTILTDYYHLYKIEGIVTATSYSALSEDDSLAAEGTIKISGTEYNYHNDTRDLLGFNVVVYVEDDDENNIAFVYPSYNEVITFEKITKFNNYTIEYEQNDRIEKISIDKSFSYIYNGRVYDGYDEMDFLTTYGSFKVVDNDNDGDYDIVFVQDVQYMHVTSVNLFEKTIYGKSLLFSSIETDIDDAYYEYYKYDGEKIVTAELSDITPGIVVALEISKDMKVGRITICEKSIEGFVSSQDNEYIVINDIQYKMSPYYIEYQKGNIGVEGTFVIGLKKDAILFSSDVSEGYVYGYLIDAKISEDLESTLTLKIFDSTGEVLIYDCENYIFVNGNRIKVSSNDINDFKLLLFDGENVKRQLLKYKISEGKIKGIDTAEMAQAIDDKSDNPDDTLIQYYDQLSTNFKANGMNNFLRFKITASTKVFIVPEKDAENVTEEDFDIETMSFFRGDSHYIVDAYDYDETGVPNAIVCYSKVSTTLGEDSSYGVMEKVVKGLHPIEGREYDKIYFWADGKFLSYYVDESVAESLIKPSGKKAGLGDVFRYIHRNGIIERLSIDFDAETMQFTADGNALVTYDSAYNKQRTYALVSFNKIYPDNILVSWTKNDGNYDYSLESLRSIPYGNNTDIIVCDRTLHPILKEEMLDYSSAKESADKALIIQGYWYTRSFVIYR